MVRVADVEDSIAASTLDVRDFIIAGYEVLDIIQPELLDDEKDDDGEYKVGDAKDIDGDSPFDMGRDPRSRVYLQLDAELGSAETPTIQILGGAVTDLAGNQNAPPQNVDSKDKIPAGLTITVTSSDSSSGRTVATDGWNVHGNGGRGRTAAAYAYPVLHGLRRNG